MTTKYTQTIWWQGEDNPLKIYGNYTSIASVDGVHATGARTHEEALANARLIAAAPELLSASLSLMDVLRGQPKGPQHEAMVKLAEAIAKTTEPNK